MPNSSISEGLASGQHMADEVFSTPTPPAQATALADAGPVPGATAGPASGAPAVAPDAPVIEDRTTFNHPDEPGVAAELIWVSGEPAPFLIPIAMLFEQTERFKPLLDLNRGDKAPIGLLKEAHAESKNYFNVQPMLPTRTPAEAERGTQALADMRAAKAAQDKARKEAEAEAKDMDKDIAAQMLEAAVKKLQGGMVPGKGFLAQILNSFQEGRIEGMLAAASVRAGVAKTGEAVVSVAQGTARKVGQAKELSTAGAKAMAATVRRKAPGAPVEPGVALDKLAAQSVFENIELFNTAAPGAKAQVNVELKVLNHNAKGAVLRFTDAEGKDIGKGIAKANGYTYDAKTGAVGAEGKAILRSAQDMVVKLVVPALTKAGMERPSVSYGSRVTSDVAEMYRQSVQRDATKAPAAKLGNTAGSGPNLMKAAPAPARERNERGSR